MYLVPVLVGLLALVLLAASFTVRRDMEKLHRWMLELDRTPGSGDSVKHVVLDEAPQAVAE
jgi:hypothetical protein